MENLLSGKSVRRVKWHNALQKASIIFYCSWCVTWIQPLAMETFSMQLQYPDLELGHTRLGCLQWSTLQKATDPFMWFSLKFTDLLRLWKSLKHLKSTSSSTPCMIFTHTFQWIKNWKQQRSELIQTNRESISFYYNESLNMIRLFHAYILQNNAKM